jgi:aminotransferase
MLCAPITAQMAALEALKNGESDMEEMVAQYDERRRLVVAGFRAMGLDCFEPQGAFYAFPSIRATGMSSVEFAEALLHEERVAVVPGPAFGECGEGFVRCAYAASTEALTEALQRIGRFAARRRKQRVPRAIAQAVSE